MWSLCQSCGQQMIVLAFKHSLKWNLMNFTFAQHEEDCSAAMDCDRPCLWLKHQASYFQRPPSAVRVGREALPVLAKALPVRWASVRPRISPLTSFSPHSTSQPLEQRPTWTAALSFRGYGVGAEPQPLRCLGRASFGHAGGGEEGISDGGQEVPSGSESI